MNPRVVLCKVVPVYLYRALSSLCRMSYTDFLRHYSRVEVCTLTPDTIDDDSVKHWSVTKLDGSWRKGSTAGGCRNHPCEYRTLTLCDPCEYRTLTLCDPQVPL